MTESEIIELHHDGKLDAPSGTAKRTADLIRGGRRATCTSRSTRCASPAWWRTRRCSSAGSGETLSIRHDSIARESSCRACCWPCGGWASWTDSPVVGLEHLL